MNLKVKCSDGEVNCSLESLEKCSDFTRGLFKDTCRCTATLYLVGLGVDSVRLATTLLEQTMTSEGGLVVEVELLAAVEPVMAALGVFCSPPSDLNNNAEVDPETGVTEVSQVLLCTCPEPSLYLACT